MISEIEDGFLASIPIIYRECVSQHPGTNIQQFSILKWMFLYILSMNDIHALLAYSRVEHIFAWKISITLKAYILFSVGDRCLKTKHLYRVLVQ